MNQRINIVILLCVLFQSLSSIAQIEKKDGKVIRIEGKTYISQHDRLFEIDEKVVLVKLKGEFVSLGKETGNLSYIAMDYYAVPVPDTIDVEKFVLQLEETDNFEFVEYNYILSPCATANDYHYDNQWHLSTINANTAWEITTGSPSVKVAVIDNGVELNHEDLYYGNDNYSNLSLTENVDYVSSTDHTPLTSHGTIIAGIIGAKTNNNVGVAGIAGGYGCQGVTIISYRTDCTVGQVSSAIYDAISKGVKVINISLEGYYTTTLSDAIDYAYINGVTVVCGTGNNGSSPISFPASHQYTIAVGATNMLNKWSEYSNFGNGIDLVAPGSVIVSTCKNSDGNYTSSSGTSMAAPQVAGVAALMLSANPYLTPGQIRYKLRSTCTKLSDYSYSNGWNAKVGYGLLNAFAAVVSVMDYDIEGPQLISSSGSYHIDNLPSGVTVSWSLSDSYYNNGYNLLIPNYPTTGHCVIVRDQSHDLTDATLMAAIKINGDTIQTLTKNGIYAYEGFRGHYTSGNISSDINYTMILPVIPNYSTYITSPNLCGATVSYSNTATIPYYWAHNPYTGEIVVIMPNNSNGIPIVFNIDDVCGNQYTLYLFAQNNYIMNISNDSNSITITLDENDDSERGLIIDQLWTIEVLNATTGVQMTSLSSTSRSVSISTSGWPSGIYIVKVTIGKEVYTEKVIVK